MSADDGDGDCGTVGSLSVNLRIPRREPSRHTRSEVDQHVLALVTPRQSNLIRTVRECSCSTCGYECRAVTSRFS